MTPTPECGRCCNLQITSAGPRPVMFDVSWQYEITTQQHRLRLPYRVTVAADIVWPN